MANKTHGMSGTRIYAVWHSMIGRCIYPGNASYPLYGGRGIKVCERWQKFENFYADMGDIPGDGYDVDRIDSDDDYCPDNCRWLSHKENIRRRDSSKLDMKKAKAIRERYAKGGVTQKALAERYGVTRSNISLVVNNKRWV
jgi:hypothetical protein